MGLLSAAAKAAKKAKVGVKTKDVPAKTKAAMEEAEKKLKAAAEKSKVRKSEAAAKVVEKKGSVAKKMTVSATDIKQANTANKLATMQRRIDDMPDGLRKKTMQNMLDKQVTEFEKMQAEEVSRASRKSAQAAADRKSKPVTLPLPSQISVQFNSTIGGIASSQGMVTSAGGSSRTGDIVSASIVNVALHSIVSQMLSTI